MSKLIKEIKDDFHEENQTNSKKNRNRKQDRLEGSEKESETGQSGEGVSPNEHQIKEVDISPYVTNVDGPVYAIVGLPEEFIATLFAWVSRSPKSFKQHLQIALKDHDIRGRIESFKELDEKARKFHEKWTVGYGHSSVAEHAVAHVGIESISRLASAELELANSFLSITEYSQRYQKPERGQWHNPIDKESENIRITVEEFFHKAFDAFEQLIKGVFEYLKKTYPEEKDSVLEKLAFEDARYVLPLSMYTQLGMTANGRAWRDALAVLGNSKHKESQKLAEDIRTEISKVLPVLLKYATPSQYQRNSKKRMETHFTERNTITASSKSAVLSSVKMESEIIAHIIALLLMKHEDLPYKAAYYKAKCLGKEKQEQIIKDLLFEMQHFDMAPEEFKHVQYQVEFFVSEANWHQLLRHNRKTDFVFSNPTPHFGITIPPRIKEAGLENLLKDIAEQSKELYNLLVEAGFSNEAEYVVLNAHRRHIFASFDLWEAYHLINLRTSEEAQWDIRETFEELYRQLSQVHPLLISQAKRRLS